MMRGASRVVAGCGMSLGLLLGSCSYSPDDTQMEKINAGIYTGTGTCEGVLTSLPAKRVISSSGLPIFNGYEARGGQSITIDFQGISMKGHFVYVDQFDGGFRYKHIGEGSTYLNGTPANIKSTIEERCEKLNDECISCRSEIDLQVEAGGKREVESALCDFALCKD